MGCPNLSGLRTSNAGGGLSGESEPRWDNEMSTWEWPTQQVLRPNRVRWDSQRTESREGKEGIEKGQREGEYIAWLRESEPRWGEKGTHKRRGMAWLWKTGYIGGMIKSLTILRKMLVKYLLEKEVPKERKLEWTLWCCTKTERISMKPCFVSMNSWYNMCVYACRINILVKCMYVSTATYTYIFLRLLLRRSKT